MTEDAIDQKVRDAAELLGITELLNRKPGELSGGQQQRVALGRAIVRDPAVFLMDEPLANLDAKLRAQMRTELQQLQNDLETTTVYVTHDQTEAMTMADKIVILDGGVLQQFAPPLECYHEPNNLFVADFIGEPSMNFFDVSADGNTLEGDDFDYGLSDETVTDLDGTTELVLGIRPEDVEVLESSTGPDAFEAVVDVVEPRGNENTVHLEFANDDATEFTATVAGMRNLGAGESVAVRFPEEAIHLFDAASGQAVRNRDLDTVELAEPRI